MHDIIYTVIIKTFSFLQIMASTVAKAIIGSKVKSITEDVEGTCKQAIKIHIHVPYIIITLLL